MESDGRIAMGEQIGVSKAARMLGVKRADLNKRLDSAGISTFEGEVDFEKVKCIAPSLDIEAPEFLDRIQCIRENAAKPVAPPPSSNDPRVLADEVQRLSSELLIETQMGHHYRQVIVDLANKLGKMQMSGSPEYRETAFELCEWLRGEITSK